MKSAWRSKRVRDTPRKYPPRKALRTNFAAHIDHRLFMGPGAARIERLLTRRNARLVLIALGAITLFFAWTLRHVRLDYDFEKFFPRNDPELDRYTAFRARFGNDNDFLLIAAERPAGVFDTAFLRRFDALAGALTRSKDVRSVLSPTRMNEPIITPAGAFQVPYLRFASDSLLATDSARIWADPRVRDAFFDGSARAMLMVLTTAPDLSKRHSDDLLAAVEAEVNSAGLGTVRLAGRIHGQHYYIEKMLHQLLLFLSVSIALLALFLWVGFRSLWGVVIPIFTVGLAILWQVGFMTLVGEPLSILTMLLPTILFVVGMSDVVHILECYLDLVRGTSTRPGLPRAQAIAATYHEVGLPTFLTAVTSAIGFATLGTASIRPLQEFGFYTGLGVLVAFLLAFTLLPALLVFIGPGALLPRHAVASPWDQRLRGLFQWTIRRRRKILLGFALIAVAGLGLASRIRVNNFLLEDWPDDDEHMMAFHWFETRFGGVRPFELEIDAAAPRGIWDLAVLRQIERVQDHAERTYHVHSILSPVTLMRSLNKAFNGGDPAYYRLPDDSATCARLARRTKLIGDRDLLQALVSADGRTARLSGRVVDEGGYVHARKNAELDSFIVAHTDPSLVRFHQTGMAWLIDRNNATLSRQLVRGMGLALVLTAAIMLWFFRDARMVLVALLPNMVPLAFIAGVMGLVGIDLKVSTAIIFSIAFGIAEDDTIHMLASLRLHLREGRSPAYALKRTYLSTGKAVTVTNLMLVSGFVSLTLSDFASVYYMGLLITLTLAFAYVAELLLLPALVMTLMKKKERKA